MEWCVEGRCLLICQRFADISGIFLSPRIPGAINSGAKRNEWNRHRRGDGHLGDLPALYVDENGKATNPVLAPRVKLADLKGRALMIHVGGDNYSDHPKPLGGGGGRMACGVIQ